MHRRILPFLAAIFLAACCLTTSRAAPPKTAGQSQELARQVDRAVDAIESARRQLPGSPLELDDVIERVGRDPAKLCDWVRTQIAFEPYRGFLKGSTGALISGRGNAADKALLLAELLAKVGVKAELVHGTAPNGARAAVTLPTEAESPDEKQLADFSARTGIPVERLRQMLRASQSAREDFLERLWTRTYHDIDALGTLLNAAKIAAPANAAPAAGADHWWVSTAAGPLDPTYSGPEGTKSQTIDPAHPPDAEFHKLIVRVMTAKDQQPSPVLEASFRSADVFGQTLTIANLPMDTADKLAAVPQATPEKLIEVLASATKFQPEIILSGTDGTNGKVFGGKGFDLTGTITEFGGGRVAQAERFGGGLGGVLGGGGGQKPKTKLTGAWLEIEIHSPGEAEPVRIRRDLMTDSPEVSPSQRVLDLLAAREILLLPEDVSGDYVAARTMTTVRQSGQYLSNHPRKDVSRSDPKELNGRPQFNPTLYAFGLARRAALRRLCDGSRGATAYAHVRPTLVSYVSRFIDAKPARSFRSIDILENTVAPVTEGNPAAPGADWKKQFAFACGVLDTALEHEILAGGSEHANASVDLARSLLGGTPPVVARGSLPADVKLSDSARAQIQPELANSAVVLLPGPRAAWYRVRLSDGSTLGYVDQAGGSEEAEYVETVEVMLQMKELLTFYGNMGRCLGAAISNPLAGVDDPHESLAKCFEALCSMIPGIVAQYAEVEASWTNIIATQSVNHIWEDLCEHLWDSVGGGEGGGGRGGGGE